MKPVIKIFFVTTFLLAAFVVTAQEQQVRPSQRSFSAEIQKINRIRAERNLYISSSNILTTDTQSAPASFKPALNPWIMKMNNARNNLSLNNFKNSSVYLSPDKKASGREMKLPYSALVRRSLFRSNN